MDWYDDVKYEFDAKSPVPAHEEGTLTFIGDNKYRVDWKYKDHVIRCIFERTDEMWKQAPVKNAKAGVSILYDNEEVSSKYLEYLNNKSAVNVRVRGTIGNLAVIKTIIDENIEDYISQEGDK